MKTLLLVFITFLIAIIATEARPKAKKDTWLFGEFSNNLIYSNVGKSQLEKEIYRLQEFELCIRHMFPNIVEHQQKSTVFIIPDTRDELYDFLPYWNDRLMNVSGVFMTGESLHVTLMDGEALSNPIPDNTILHEYVHKILAPAGYTPPWVAEGLAEALAHFEKDGKYYYFGREIGLKLAHLRNDPQAYMSLIDMFRTGLDSTNYHVRGRQQGFYTTAWLMATYCLNSQNEDLRTAYVKLWARNLEEPITDEVFRECFGFGIVAFEVQLRAAMKSGTINHRRISISDIPRPEKVRFQKVEADELNLAKALAVIRAGRPEDLGKYLSQEIASDQYSEERSKSYASEILFWKEAIENPPVESDNE